MSESTHKKPLPELVIEFDEPIVRGNKTFEQMVLREPKVSEEDRALEAFEAETRNALKQRAFYRTLMSKISGVPVDVISELRRGQFEEAFQYLESFLDNGEKDGES